MPFVTSPYVDAQDGIPATIVPLRNGPALPSPQLTVDAVDHRQSPPLIIGTLPGDAIVPAVCTMIDEATHAGLIENYNAWCQGLQEAERQQCLVQLATYRFRVETGGVDFNGSRILTDRESQAQLNGALQALESGFVAQVDWKAAEAWVSVTLDVIKPIGAEVARHVQACFTAERAVAEAFTAGTLQSSIREAFDTQLGEIKAATQPAS